VRTRELAVAGGGGISANAMADTARTFKRLRPPTSPPVQLGRPAFGRRVSVPDPTPAPRRASRSAQAFCAAMIVYGIVMIVLDRL